MNECSGTTPSTGRGNSHIHGLWLSRTAPCLSLPALPSSLCPGLMVLPHYSARGILRAPETSLPPGTFIEHPSALLWADTMTAGQSQGLCCPLPCTPPPTQSSSPWLPRWLLACPTCLHPQVWVPFFHLLTFCIL